MQRLANEIIYALTKDVRRTKAGFAFEAELGSRIARPPAIIEHLVAELDVGLELYPFRDIERLDGGERGGDLLSDRLKLCLQRRRNRDRPWIDRSISMVDAASRAAIVR
jgi:hypothetical protein